MLKEQIDNDLTSALKAKDQLRAETLRMLKARIKNEEISSQKDLDDEKLLAAISSEIKKRRDSVTAYQAAGRQELADKESKEIEILGAYLPPQLSEAEVEKIIDAGLAGKNFTAADFGKAMGALMPQLKGKADGSLISKLLKDKLK